MEHQLCLSPTEVSRFVFIMDPHRPRILVTRHRQGAHNNVIIHPARHHNEDLLLQHMHIVNLWHATMKEKSKEIV